MSLIIVTWYVFHLLPALQLTSMGFEIVWSPSGALFRCLYVQAQGVLAWYTYSVVEQLDVLLLISSWAWGGCSAILVHPAVGLEVFQSLSSKASGRLLCIYQAVLVGRCYCLWSLGAGTACWWVWKSTGGIIFGWYGKDMGMPEREIHLKNLWEWGIFSLCILSLGLPCPVPVTLTSQGSELHFECFIDWNKQQELLLINLLQTSNPDSVE